MLQPLKQVRIQGKDIAHTDTLRDAALEAYLLATMTTVGALVSTEQGLGTYFGS
jgi:hypothetical protein